MLRLVSLPVSRREMSTFLPEVVIIWFHFVLFEYRVCSTYTVAPEIYTQCSGIKVYKVLNYKKKFASSLLILFFSKEIFGFPVFSINVNSVPL